jgi:hypothetical protein
MIVDSERSLIRTVHGGGCHPGIAFILDRAAILTAPTHSEPTDHLSSSASRPLKTRQTVWGVISDDASWDTRLWLVHCLPGASEQLVDAYGTP